MHRFVYQCLYISVHACIMNVYIGLTCLPIPIKHHRISANTLYQHLRVRRITIPHCCHQYQQDVVSVSDSLVTGLSFTESRSVFLINVKNH